MSGSIDSLKGCSDAILGIREQIGADIHKVYLVTRTWTGESVGAGECIETEEKIEPTPAVTNLSTDHRVKEGGSVRVGDLEIRQISKNKYPNKEDIDCSSSDPLVEKFYKIGDALFVVINVMEKYITWNVQVRRRSDQRSVGELNNAL
jgi:hypothetical protein